MVWGRKRRNSMYFVFGLVKVKLRANIQRDREKKKESLMTLQAWPLSNSKNNFPGVLPIKIIKEESCYLQNSNWSGMITFAAMQKNNNDAMQGRLHSNNCPQQQQHRCLILNGNSTALFWQIVFKSNLCHFNWLPLLL